MAFDLVAALLQTQALQIAPAEEMFWYTSGTIGPYYINTHYLYGGPQKADELLGFIDAEKANRTRFPGLLLERAKHNYAEEEIYREVVDALVRDIRESVGEDFGYVSGGERRDWFFSPLVADLLHKPHLVLYKDRSAVVLGGVGIEEVDGLQGVKTVHIADLVTEASSYFRAWMPAIHDRGGRMVYGLNVVDRAQGGVEALNAAGVPAAALLRVDEDLFDMLLHAGSIDREQRDVLVAYYRDPHAAMKAFLEEHPDFLQQALAADERTAGRARMLVEQNPYGLDI